MKNLENYNQIPGDMERVQRILCHAEFKKSMEEIRILEKDRIFCCHGMEHLLDVARIAYIDNLEQAYGYPKDVVYAAGLLHDVGKYLQYREGIPHHISSEVIARQILEDTGYSAEEIEMICFGILNHRSLEDAGEDGFCRMLYRADKISRACYACSASEKCHWSEEKKTVGVIA